MNIEVVDMSAPLKAIKEEFGSRYYLEKKAIEKAAILWGACSNESGVFLYLKEETLLRAGKCEGLFRYIQTSKGYWLIGVSAQTTGSGFGYAPSVWDKYGFKSYHDARLAAVTELQRFFQQKIRASSSRNAEFENALSALKTEETPQLNLF